MHHFVGRDRRAAIRLAEPVREVAQLTRPDNGMIKASKPARRLQRRAAGRLDAEAQQIFRGYQAFLPGRKLTAPYRVPKP